MIDVFDLLDGFDVDQNPLEGFYRALVKKYVALVDSPFILQRLCMHLYKSQGFDLHFDIETFDEICLELQQ